MAEISAKDLKGIIVLPIGSNNVSIDDCKKTLLTPLNKDKIDELSSVDRPELTRIISGLLEEHGELVVWGARQRSFLSNRHVSIVEDLINKTLSGERLGLWLVLFYTRRRLVCPGLLVGAVKSRVLAAQFWPRAGPEWEYIFFIKTNKCKDHLNEDCTPLDGAGRPAEEFNTIVGYSPDYIYRRVVIFRKDELSGRFDDRFYEVINSILAELPATQVQSKPEVKEDSESSTCGFLEQFIPNLELLLRLAEGLLELKHALLLYGPPGMGKTSLARCIASRMGASVYTVTGHMWLTRHALIGGYVLMGGSLVWKDGLVIEAASKAGGRKAVIVLDEINRGEPEKILAELFTALGRHDHKLEVRDRPDGAEVDLSNVYIIATANSADFQALGRLGMAFLRRFPTLYLHPPSPDESGVFRHVEDAIGRLLSEELVGYAGEAGDDCIKRVARASVEVWRTVLENINDESIAPGWSYPYDMARLLARTYCAGARDNTREACSQAVRALYGGYTLFGFEVAEEGAGPDSLEERAVKKCEAILSSSS